MQFLFILVVSQLPQHLARAPTTIVRLNSHQKAAVEKRMKKQRRLTLGVMCIAALDVALIVVPNCLLLVIALDWLNPTSIFSLIFNYYAAVAAMLRCSVNLPIQFVFNVDFYTALRDFFQCRRATSVSIG